MNDANGSQRSIQTSFADYLKMLEPDVSTRLVSESCFSRIKDLASHLPGCLAFSPFGFECPLGADDAEADFLFSLQKYNLGPAVLAGQQKENDFDTSLFQIPQWRQVRGFGELWANPTEPLYSGIDDVWMEFDIASVPGTQNAHAPSLFLAPFVALSDSFIEKLSANEALNFLGTIFMKLNGRYPPAACLKNWKFSLENLPNIRNLFQVGFMIARPDSSMLRTCVAFNNMDNLKVLLDLLKWPGDFRNLDLFSRKLNTFFDSFALHLDLGETVSGKIGIECQFRYHQGSAHGPRWLPFLDVLTEMGLCQMDKRNALIQYPGYRETNMHACPIPLKNMACRHFPLYRSFFVRINYHIKLVLDLSGEWKAKAYLGINHLWKGLMDVTERNNGPWGIIG